MRLRRLLGFGLPAVLLTQCEPQCTPQPPEPAPPSVPTPAPPGLVQFGNGIKLVGRDVGAATYYASTAESCYWERLSGLGGTTDDIIVNDITSGQLIVTIAPTDVAFDSSTRCGPWTLYSGAAPAVARITAGDWHVGQQVTPGRWATEGSTDGCYWERASGFTHDFDELITNDIGDGQRVVDLAATDVRFSSSERCGAWVRIG
jgi:hypothetical protein